MVESCIDLKCRDCNWHVLKTLKVSCNYEDRLGLGRAKLSRIVEEEIEEGEPSGV